MKAYQVDGYGDTGSVIVFAERSVMARRNGARELDIDFESVESCRRKPQWDRYAKQRWVPLQELIEHGWHYECFGCYGRITADEYHVIGVDVHPVFDGQEGFCSLKCRHAEMIRRKLIRRTVAAIPRYVRKKWRGAELVRCDANIWHRNGERSAYATIRFPGGKYAVDVRFREGETHRKNNRIAIEKYPAVFVTETDARAWDAFVGKGEAV